jgi:hypothetical protein
VVLAAAGLAAGSLLGCLVPMQVDAGGFDDRSVPRRVKGAYASPSAMAYRPPLTIRSAFAGLGEARHKPGGTEGGRDAVVAGGLGVVARGARVLVRVGAGDGVGPGARRRVGVRAGVRGRPADGAGLAGGRPLASAGGRSRRPPALRAALTAWPGRARGAAAQGLRAGGHGHRLRRWLPRSGRDPLASGKPWPAGPGLHSAGP